MLGLYLITDSIIYVENQKKGLCLISAFFQGLHRNNREMQANASSHLTENRITDDIVNESIMGSFGQIYRSFKPSINQ